MAAGGCAVPVAAAGPAVAVWLPEVKIPGG